MNFSVITTATVKAHTVSWATNGGIYMARDLHDLLRPALQGISYRAKTIREFENVCALLAA